MPAYFAALQTLQSLQRNLPNSTIGEGNNPKKSRRYILLVCYERKYQERAKFRSKL